MDLCKNTSILLLLSTVLFGSSAKHSRKGVENFCCGQCWAISSWGLNKLPAGTNSDAFSPFPWVLLSLWISAWNSNLKILHLIRSIANYSFNLIKWKYCLSGQKNLFFLQFGTISFFLYFWWEYMLKMSSLPALLFTGFLFYFFFIPSCRGSLFFQLEVFLLNRT